MDRNQKIACIILVILLLHSISVITTTLSTAIKSYLVTRKLTVEIENITLKVGGETVMTITYNICNPLDFRIYIVSIQSIIYSGGTYVWTNTSIFMRPPAIYSNHSVKEVSIKIPQTRIKYIKSEVTVITYILVEVRQPRSYKIILEFYFPKIKYKIQ